MTMAWFPLQVTQFGSIVVSLLVIGVVVFVIMRALRRTRRLANWDAYRSRLLNEISSEPRFRVYQRDGYTCQRCGTASDLQVDFSSEPPVAGPVRLNSLTTLCARCAAIIRQSGKMQ